MNFTMMPGVFWEICNSLSTRESNKLIKRQKLYALSMIIGGHCMNMCLPVNVSMSGADDLSNLEFCESKDKAFYHSCPVTATTVA